MALSDAVADAKRLGDAAFDSLPSQARQAQQIANVLIGGAAWLAVGFAVPMIQQTACKAPKCREKFIPRNSLDVVCSLKCALAFAKSKKAEKHARLALRVEKRERKEKLKRPKEHEDDAQRAFNAFIRERDIAEPCICCGRWPKTPSNHQWDAGHYRTTAAASQLRFDEDNCHKQLVSCNRGKSGNAVEYRLRLVAKIGPERVEALEHDSRIVRRSVDELKAIRKVYQVKLRELRQAREMGQAAA